VSRGKKSKSRRGARDTDNTDNTVDKEEKRLLYAIRGNGLVYSAECFA